MNAPTLVYVVDANVLIQAQKGYYGFSICPGFWDCLLLQHQAGRVISIDQVRAEIEDGSELDQWVENSVPGTFFSSTQDQAVTAAYADLVQWGQAQSQFLSAAKAEFNQVADGWLIAFTMCRADHVLVTHEQFSPDIRRKVPIPNLCRQFGVPYLDTFEMLNDPGVRLVLAD
jgi:hypothetical protein